MPKHDKVVKKLAKQYGFSEGAVMHLWGAMVQGRGMQAQFNHPEFGGMGQWQAGGMMMIGDMFNQQLKANVDALCHALQGPVVEYVTAQQQQTTRVPPARQWWPDEYGAPDVEGAQNDIRYAYFAKAKRLVVETGGSQTIYKTGKHKITGFSQQNGRLQFNSQLGTFGLAELSQA